MKVLKETCNPQDSFPEKKMKGHQRCDSLLRNNHNTWDQKGNRCHVKLFLSMLEGNMFQWACEKPKKNIHVHFDIAL